MSLLLIEDNPNRIKQFRQGLIGISVTQICTASSAIAWLGDHTPKLIFLDYDLHEFGKEIKESGSGGEIAAWMAKQKKRFNRTLVVIHSLNENGAERMAVKLRGAYIDVARMPYVWERPAELEGLLHRVLS